MGQSQISCYTITAEQWNSVILSPFSTFKTHTFFLSLQILLMQLKSNWRRTVHYMTLSGKQYFHCNTEWHSTSASLLTERSTVVEKWGWGFGVHLQLNKILSIAPNPEATIHCPGTTKLAYMTNIFSPSGFKRHGLHTYKVIIFWCFIHLPCLFIRYSSNPALYNWTGHFGEHPLYS